MAEKYDFPKVIVKKEEGPFATMQITENGMKIPIVLPESEGHLPDKFEVQMGTSSNGERPFGKITDLNNGVVIAEGTVEPYIQLLPPGAGLSIGKVMMESDLLPQLILGFGLGPKFVELLPPGLAGPGGLIIEADALPQIPILPSIGVSG